MFPEVLRRSAHDVVKSVSKVQTLSTLSPEVTVPLAVTRKPPAGHESSEPQNWGSDPAGMTLMSEATILEPSASGSTTWISAHVLLPLIGVETARIVPSPAVK